MVTEVTRYINQKTERELWARAAGRCQFEGCNKLLYRSAVTQEAVNQSQKAHIYSFSANGPRGQGPYSDDLENINSIDNLMLMCHGCHKLIDDDKKGQRYSAKLLQDWKIVHEQRIEIVTGISTDKRSNVILYGANIGDELSPLYPVECMQSMFPERYPASSHPIQLSMKSALKDDTPDYWSAEVAHLEKSFERKVLTIAEDDDCKHFSLFALAPQPLLIKLGSLLTDKFSVETYQLHREPKGWRWKEEKSDIEFIVKKPEGFSGQPVLAVALSDHIAPSRITNVLGEDVSIWEITIDSPNNDVISSKILLSRFRTSIRQIIVDIKREHGNQTPLHLFPVMPISCAIELGRARMPKPDMTWIVYDHDRITQTFKTALEI